MNALYKALVTIFIYVILLTAGFVLNQHYPSVHGPGLGLIFMILVVPLVALCMFIRDLYFIVKGRKDFYLSLIAHLVVFCLALLAL